MLDIAVKDKLVVTSKKANPSPVRRRRRRQDAEQNVELILDAATTALSTRPDASIEDIAKTAGLSRQTVYAHFSSRELLLGAVVERAAAEVSVAFEATDLDQEPPTEALLRLLELAWDTSARYPFLWHLPQVSHQDDIDRHAPVLERMETLIARGQQSGELQADLSPAWLLTAALALGRAAENEVKQGRMSIAEATQTVHSTLLRLLGLPSMRPRTKRDLSKPTHDP
jgi:AcrR family transcriptional regulator